MSIPSNFALQTLDTGILRFSRSLQKNKYKPSDECVTNISSVLTTLQQINKDILPPEESIKEISSIISRIQFDLHSSADLNLIKQIAAVFQKHHSNFSKTLVQNFSYVLSKHKKNFPILKTLPERYLTIQNCRQIINDKLKDNAILTDIKICHLAGIVDKILQYDLAEDFTMTLICKELYRGKHLCPLFIRNKEGILDIICSDSVACETKVLNDEEVIIPSSYIEMLISSLQYPNENDSDNDDDNQSKKDSIRCNFYFLKTQRQFDEFNCASFTINDVISFYKMQNKGFDLFKFVSDQSQPYQTSEPSPANPAVHFFVFSMLPPQMMTLTQSQKVIKDYSSQFNANVSSSAEMETLQSSLERYHFMGSYIKKDTATNNETFVIAPLNAHAQIKYSRYSCKMIAALIDQLIDGAALK